MEMKSARRGLGAARSEYKLMAWRTSGMASGAFSSSADGNASSQFYQRKSVHRVLGATIDSHRAKFCLQNRFELCEGVSDRVKVVELQRVTVFRFLDCRSIRLDVERKFCAEVIVDTLPGKHYRHDELCQCLCCGPQLKQCSFPGYEISVLRLPILYANVCNPVNFVSRVVQDSRHQSCCNSFDAPQ